MWFIKRIRKVKVISKAIKLNKKNNSYSKYLLIDDSIESEIKQMVNFDEL